jgi:hypothetical protein
MVALYLPARSSRPQAIRLKKSPGHSLCPATLRAPGRPSTALYVSHISARRRTSSSSMTNLFCKVVSACAVFCRDCVSAKDSWILAKCVVLKRVFRLTSVHDLISVVVRQTAFPRSSVLTPLPPVFRSLIHELGHVSWISPNKELRTDSICSTFCWNSAGRSANLVVLVIPPA